MLKLNAQRGYRKFVDERDGALEVILRNSRLRISEMTAVTFRKVLESIQLKYSNILHTSSRHMMDQLEGQVQGLLDHLAFQIWIEIIEMRKKAFMLSYAGEAQAIAQTLAKSPKLALSKVRLDQMMNKNFSNGLSPHKSIGLQFSKLRRQITSSLEYSVAFGEPVDKALGRIFLLFPRQGELPKRRVLKPVRLTEATKPTFSLYDQLGSEPELATVLDFSSSRQAPVHGFDWDQETWDKVRNEISGDYALTNRSPENYVDLKNPFNDLPIREKVPGVDKIYLWEVENEVTNDFVENVREGQVEAAKKQGITDFVWIGILDNRTDECCAWRSGLTTKEIEEKLKTEYADEDCRAVTPPAHFNCRCTLAPASEDLVAVDNNDMEREFSEWLAGA